MSLEGRRVAESLRRLGRSFLMLIHPDRWAADAHAVKLNGEMVKEWMPISEGLIEGWQAQQAAMIEQPGRALAFYTQNGVERMTFPFAIGGHKSEASLLPRATYAALYLYSRAGLVIDHNLVGWLQSQLGRTDPVAEEGQFKHLYAAQREEPADLLLTIPPYPFLFIAPSLTRTQKRMALEGLVRAANLLADWDPDRLLIIWNGPRQVSGHVLRLPYSFHPKDLQFP